MGNALMTWEEPAQLVVLLCTRCSGGFMKLQADRVIIYATTWYLLSHAMCDTVQNTKLGTIFLSTHYAVTKA